MKVSPCNTVEEDPRKFSYEQLRNDAPEGVYSDGGSQLRWIVLATSKHRAILLYSKTAGVLEVSYSAVGAFIKVDETICFELKKA